MSQQDDSRKVIEDLKNDGCANRHEFDRCAYHKGDKKVTEIVQEHYKIVFPEDE